MGTLVDRHGAPPVDPTNTPQGGTFLIRCCLRYRRGQGEANRLFIPAGGGLRAQVLRECLDGPLGTRGALRASQNWVAGAAPRLLGGSARRRRRVRALVPDVPAHHGGARRLLHPLPLPSRHGGMIGVD